MAAGALSLESRALGRAGRAGRRAAGDDRMLTAILAATLLNATYVSEACKFSFDYPAKWTVVANPAAQVKSPPLFDTVEKCAVGLRPPGWRRKLRERSEEHTSELQSPCNLVCRLLLEKKNNRHETC